MLSTRNGIGQIFLPPYSTNLNLIERFWKLVKTTALNAAYHGT
ncbi:MAG: transposase [Treponema sp.]|nr:transposase [Treponema sp.]